MDRKTVLSGILRNENILKCCEKSSNYFKTCDMERDR